MTSLMSLKTLPALATELDQFFAMHVQANAQLAHWLSSHFQAPMLRNLVQQILNNPELLQSVSARSYQHGNGFLKVVLLDRGYKLRLHIWFAGQACEENIHDHRWSFASHILTGTLRSEIWRDVNPCQASNFAADEFEYHAAGAGQAAYKVQKGQCRLVREAEVAYHAGQSYVMPEETLHRIINLGDALVATIMCTAPTAQGTTRLIPTHNGIDPNIQPPKLSAEQLRQQLQRFLTLFDKEGSH